MAKKTTTTRTVYVKDTAVWRRAERLARLSGRSVSAYVEETLRKSQEKVSDEALERGEAVVRELIA